MLSEKKIVLIDNDSDFLKLFKRLLSDFGNAKVLTETHGDKGLDLIKNFNPDIVILDICLNGMNGVEICIEIKKDEKLRKIPVIAITSLFNNSQKKEMVNAGFDKILLKPIDLHDIIKILNSFSKKN